MYWLKQNHCASGDGESTPRYQPRDSAHRPGGVPSTGRRNSVSQQRVLFHHRLYRQPRPEGGINICIVKARKENRKRDGCGGQDGPCASADRRHLGDVQRQDGTSGP